MLKIKIINNFEKVILERRACTFLKYHLYVLRKLRREKKNLQEDKDKGEG